MARVPHVTRDSDTTFKVKRSRSPGHFTHRGMALTHQAATAVSVGTYWAWGNYCYVVVCLAALGASAPAEGWEGRGISWRLPAYTLFYIVKVLTEIVITLAW